MTCKINIIKPTEFTQFFKGKLCFFAFSPGKDSVESRQLLQIAKQQALEKILSPFTPSKPIAYDFHSPTDFPNLSLSISHTQTFGAIALAERKDHDSIGVDIELSKRDFNLKGTKFFMNPEEDASDLLELWTKKEAAFKACAPIYADCTLLKDLIIKQEKIFHKNRDIQIGAIKTCKINFEGENFILSLAKTI